MGIRGLTTYINNRSQKYFEYYELHDCNLVIDGDSLCSALVNWHFDDLKSGFAPVCYAGDYDRHAHTVKCFFEMLKECNITPYVILDGGYDDHRIPVVKERLNKKVKLCSDINPDVIRRVYSQDFLHVDQRQANVLVNPLKLTETFRFVLKSLNIKTARCQFESDNEAACLAKLLNCPVLSKDSDFFLFGSLYIPFDTLECAIQKTKRRGNPYKFIPCKIYKIEKLLRDFVMQDQNKIYLLPVLLGNDYISAEMFSDFFRWAKIFGYGQKRIEGLFRWMAWYPTVEDALVEVLKTFYNIEQIQYVFKKIELVINGYFKIDIGPLLKHFGIEIPVGHIQKGLDFANLKQFFGMTGVSAYNEKQVLGKEVKVSPRFKQNFTKDKYPGFFLDMLTKNAYYMGPQIEDSSKTDSHAISYPLTAAIHKILTGDNRKCLTVLKRNEQFELGDFELPEFAISVPKFEEIEVRSGVENRRVIWEILGFNECFGDVITQFPEEWHVLVLSLNYARKLVKFQCCFVHSLILCVIILNRVDGKLNGFYRTMRDLETAKNPTQNAPEEYKFMRKTVHFFEMKRSDTADTYDRSLLHDMAQLKSVFIHLNFLNVLLNRPFEEGHLHRVFNGTFIYNLGVELKQVRDYKVYLDDLFRDCSGISAEFYRILDLLESNCVI